MRRRCAGQALVLVMAFLASCVLAVALTFNVGQLVKAAGGGQAKNAAATGLCGG